MKIPPIIVIPAILAAYTMVARSAEIVLNPIADSTVDAITPDEVDHNGPLLAAAEGAFGEPATVLSFVYTQFMLPDGMTGRDIGVVNSVDLQFSRANPNTALSLTYYAYGVFDGFDVGSADDYTWNDGIGFFPENTEIRNFADANEISYYSDPAESSFIGTIGFSSSDDPTRPFGFNPAQTEGSRINLRNLFLNDTDGKITILTKVRQNFAVTSVHPFESIEDTNEFTSPPTLLLDFSEGLAGDYNGDRSVDAADYTVWRDTLGSESHLGADGSGNGVVDNDDYGVWKQNFVGGAESSASAVASAAFIVPEPAGLALAGLLMGFFLRRAGP